MFVFSAYFKPVLLLVKFFQFPVFLLAASVPNSPFSWQLSTASNSGLPPPACPVVFCPASQISSQVSQRTTLPHCCLLLLVKPRFFTLAILCFISFQFCFKTEPALASGQCKPSFGCPVCLPDKDWVGKSVLLIWKVKKAKGRVEEGSNKLRQSKRS